MKLFLMSSDANGRHCGTIKNQLLDYLPFTDNLQEADAVVVTVTYFLDFKFNEELRKIKKPYILIDYCEYGWDWNQEHRNTFGSMAYDCFEMYSGMQWSMFDDWVHENDPSTYFKRELLERDRTERLLPCEYLCYLPKTPIQSEEEFNARPIECFYNFGWSHPSRINLHSDIIRAMNTHNIGTITNWTQLPQYFEHKSPRTWLSIYSPWYDRQPMKNVLEWQSNSKLSICFPGAGIKTFRHGECVDTVPVIAKNKLAWSYPWKDGINCVMLDSGKELEQIEWATTQGKAWLYPMYYDAQYHMDNYRPKNYVANYILPNISKNL